MPRSRILALLWTLAILAACTIPGSSLPSVSLFEHDKLIHMALFAVFAWLWMAALPLSFGRRSALVMATGVAYAVLTEVYQGLLPFDRRPDPLDAVADIAGVTLGILIFVLARRKHVKSTA